MEAAGMFTSQWFWRFNLRGPPWNRSLGTTAAVIPGVDGTTGAVYHTNPESQLCRQAQSGE